MHRAGGRDYTLLGHILASAPPRRREHDALIHPRARNRLAPPPVSQPTKTLYPVDETVQRGTREVGFSRRRPARRVTVDGARADRATARHPVVEGLREISLSRATRARLICKYSLSPRSAVNLAQQGVRAVEPWTLTAWTIVKSAD